MSHISFSELKMWNECPFKRKLVYPDKINGFEGNIFTAFGKAVHSGCEKYVEGRDIDFSIGHFIDAYSEELSSLPKNVTDKGYIDLVIKTDDGRYHIIDWKTCSWGWDARRRSDAMNVYQLIFYKHYYALKHNIDIDKIDVHFGLLKRTGQSGSSVEIFKTPSGKIRSQNALKLLNQALYNISKNRHIKNKTSCHGNFGQCEFYKTEHCP